MQNTKVQSVPGLLATIVYKAHPISVARNNLLHLLEVVKLLITIVIISMPKRGVLFRKRGLPVFHHPLTL